MYFYIPSQPQTNRIIPTEFPVSWYIHNAVRYKIKHELDILSKSFERKSITTMHQRAMISARISSRAFPSLGTKEHGNELG